MPREKHANCAASTQKIYIRKDLNSPLIATPTFISDPDTDGSRLVEIRPTGKPQGRALSIDPSLWILCEPVFNDALFHVQIQPARPGDAGGHPAACHAEWFNVAAGLRLKGTAAASAVTDNITSASICYLW